MTDSEERSKYDPPPGHYAMRLVEVKKRLTDDGDKPFYAMTFFIMEGTDSHWVDREWRRRMYLTPAAEPHTKQDLIRMGASPRSLNDPDLLLAERLVFECDVVHTGRWANMKNITTRIELHPVPPTGPRAEEPEEPLSQMGLGDW